VIDKRAGGMGLISGRRVFQKPMGDGIEILNAIQKVYLNEDVTIAWPDDQRRTADCQLFAPAARELPAASKPAGGWGCARVSHPGLAHAGELAHNSRQVDVEVQRYPTPLKPAARSNSPTVSSPARR
jgi:hypothetical protein